MGKTYLTEDEVRAAIRKVTQESSLRQVAAEKNLSPAYLSDILTARRSVSEYVAGLFGFDRIEKTTVKFQRQ